MVEPREALFALLYNDDAVRNSVTDIVHGRRPTDAQLPVLVIWPTISNVPERDLNGPAFWRARLQVTVVAHEQEQAEIAKDAVINCVDGFSGDMYGLPVIEAWLISDEQVMQDDEVIFHHIDFYIRYKKSA